MTRHDHHHHHHYYHHAGQTNDEPSPNPHRLYRSPHRVLGGVCAGVAAYFGWRTKFVRLFAIIGLLTFTPAFVFTYLAAWWFLPARPGGRLYATAAEERFWRNVSTRPSVTLSELRHRFRALEGRIADMERTVTSEEFQLRRQFRDLEG
ncbi:MAG: envelope stress response membrane protein PspC [Geminicoccaceae bacterium]